ncbi:MAG: TMEM165/GDT1 family protein [Candidatus Heimdallarchaeota archaeon]|nr:TMEM165/GDT1 family protein [Candidatus Heimdallarchaeota archaeon]
MASFVIDLMTTAGVMLVAEFADKTNLLALSLMGKSKQPYTVALGGLLGITFVTLIGVLLGGLIVEVIPIDYVPILTGLLFVWIGIAELRNDEETEEIEIDNINENSGFDNRFNVMKKSFVLIGLAEFGDKSQIFVIGRSLEGNPLAIFLGAVIGMGIIMLVTAIFDEKLIERFPEDLIHKIANYGFVIVGILLIINGLTTIN